MTLKHSSQVDCSQSENITDLKNQITELTKTYSTLKPQVDSLLHVIEGNGQKGLKEVVVRLDENVNRLSKNQEVFSTSLVNFTDSLVSFKTFQTEMLLKTKLSEKDAVRQEIKRNNVRWLIFTCAALALTIIGLIIDLHATKAKVDENAIKTEITQ